MGVFLIFLLAVSRLIVVRKPETRLPADLAWIIPAGYIFLMLGVAEVLLMLLKVKSIAFSADIMSCAPCVRVSSGQVHLRNQLVLAVRHSIQVGLPVVPISGAVFLLYQRGRQHSASKTILLITLLYLVCNLPVLLADIYSWAWYLSLDNTQHTMPLGQYTTARHAFYPTGFASNYSALITARVLPALNGVLNPLVFMWRMRPFRDFIRMRCWNRRTRHTKNGGTSPTLNFISNNGVFKLPVPHFNTCSFKQPSLKLNNYSFKQPSTNSPAPKRHIIPSEPQLCSFKLSVPEPKTCVFKHPVPAYLKQLDETSL